MKVKVEIDLTPDEAKELFIPSEKQAEFAAALAKGYAEAMTKAAQSAFEGTVNSIFGDKK